MNKQHIASAEDIVDLPCLAGEIPSFFPDPNDHILTTFFTNSSANSETTESFLTEKEARDKQISIKLRAKGIITTPGKLFAIS